MISALPERQTMKHSFCKLAAFLLATLLPLSLCSAAPGPIEADIYETVAPSPTSIAFVTNIPNSSSSTMHTLEDEFIIPPSPGPLARAASRIYYPYPRGAMAVDLYKDGRRVLSGEVADIGGTVYVPVQRFADLFGDFSTTYTEDTETYTLKGPSLLVTVRVGDLYITVNDRVFYTVTPILSLGGWIFVPITPITKALGSTVTIRAGYYEAYITTGDPTAVATAAEVYDSTDLYWLSRIISAESRGEPLRGQMAVGTVVLNRTRSTSFPNTVKDVVFDRKNGTQFAPVSNGTIYNTPTSSAILAAKMCLEGYSISSRILYFFNPTASPSNWISRNRPYLFTIGNHKFYG